MRTLYEKSEIWFSLVWIVVYVIGTSIADVLSEKTGVTKSITLLFLIILCSVAFIWVKQNGLFEKYGLCKTHVKASKFLYYIPLLVMITCNFWFGTAQNLEPAEVCFYIGSMLCVGFLEELIFRGFLFKAMCRDSVKAAIIVSSLTFGIGHIVNLVNGSGADLIANLCQVCYATVTGFLFVIIFHRGKSLWPCIVTHGVFNALSVFGGEEGVTNEEQMVAALLLMVIAGGYALILLKTLPTGKELSES